MSHDHAKEIRVNEGAGSELRIEQSTREVIERKLLTSLSEGGHIAILAGREELELFILGMDKLVGSEKAKEMAEDLRKLRDAAFPGFPG